MSKITDKTEQLIVERYINQNIGMTKLAKIYKTNLWTVYRIIVKNVPISIRRRKRVENLSKGNTFNPPGIKFTHDDVRRIRKEFNAQSGCHIITQLAKKYDVCYLTIYKIVNGKTWRHVK